MFFCCSSLKSFAAGNRVLFTAIKDPANPWADRAIDVCLDPDV